MLIHLVPQMYACRFNAPQCSLIDIESPELGIKLKAGVDIIARRPYPNKNYLVACRKAGQKAIDGLFVQTKAPLNQFNIITRWAVDAEHVVTHKVCYLILDDELDAVSTDMTMWYAMCESLGGWGSRWPKTVYCGEHAPVALQPRMELVPSKRAGEYTDLMDRNVLVERSEVFRVPTIESERLLPVRRDVSIFSRLPKIEDAFTATV